MKRTLFYKTISSARFNFNCLSQLHKKHNSINSTNILSMSNWYSISCICKTRYSVTPQIHSISQHHHPKSQFRKLGGGIERLDMIFSLLAWSISQFSCVAGKHSDSTNTLQMYRKYTYIVVIEINTNQYLNTFRPRCKQNHSR